MNSSALRVQHHLIATPSSFPCLAAATALPLRRSLGFNRLPSQRRHFPVFSSPPRCFSSSSYKMAPATKEFFSSTKYAIAGASRDPKKIGNKVVKWYKEHGFEAIPIHPKESEVEELSTIASVFDLVDAKETSLSVITPPAISLPIVKTSLLELDIPWIWLQPGAEDDNLKEWVDSLPDEDLKKRVIFGGPCILVEGEELAKAEGKL